MEVSAAAANPSMEVLGDLEVFFVSGSRICLRGADLFSSSQEDGGPPTKRVAVSPYIIDSVDVLARIRVAELPVKDNASLVGFGEDVLPLIAWQEGNGGRHAVVVLGGNCFGNQFVLGQGAHKKCRVGIHFAFTDAACRVNEVAVCFFCPEALVSEVLIAEDEDDDEFRDPDEPFPVSKTFVQGTIQEYEIPPFTPGNLRFKGASVELGLRVQSSPIAIVRTNEAGRDWTPSMMDITVSDAYPSNLELWCSFLTGGDALLQRIWMLKAIVEQLQQMHAHRVTHGDPRLENVFMDAQDRPLFGDLDEIELHLPGEEGYFQRKRRLDIVLFFELLVWDNDVGDLPRKMIRPGDDPELCAWLERLRMSGALKDESQAGRDFLGELLEQLDGAKNRLEVAKASSN